MNLSVLGIDLGTSNTVIAAADCEEKTPVVLPIVQLSGPGKWSEERLLPSALYIPSEQEYSAADRALPWEPDQRDIAGLFAREQGVLQPDRVILSAKSWLSSSHIDRKGQILPWQSDAVEQKLSPYEVSRRLLEYIRKYLHHSEFNLTEDAGVVLTVPASFDEVARTLTYEAAAEAGFHSVTLLEEPQAAFYAWLKTHETEWRDILKTGDSILVCDVGGGTADFTMIMVTEEDGQLALQRISVGEHILLGGDNMDLALAYTVKNELEQEGQNIDHWQFLGLVNGCRNAKEKLWSDSSLEQFPVALPSRSANLFESTITATIRREHLNSVIIEGFFPLKDPHELPATKRQTGIRTPGLRFAGDPVVTHQLINFLQRSATTVLENETLRSAGAKLSKHDKPLLIPDKILFNGGVFHAEALADRIMSMLSRWSDGAELVKLSGADGDTAVATGAAYYGISVIRGDGIKIRAGTTRAYYLGVESAMPAVPGMEPPLQALCVAPQGMEEGSVENVKDQEFDLIQGEPVSFRFFSSTERSNDQAGSMYPKVQEDMEEVASLEIEIPAEEGKAEPYVPVYVETVVTEVGVLELWMQEKNGPGRWKLEINVRHE